MSEPPDHDRDEEPRQGFWATLPRGTIRRVLLLLVLLAVVVALQRKAGAIAGCMSQALMPPHTVGSSRSNQGAPAIHVQVQVPDAAKR